ALTRYRVTLETGAVRTGDVLVLAPGNPPPSPPRWAGAAVRDHPRYIGNPWKTEAFNRLRPDDRVLIVGTGLTMADVVASRRARGHSGAITALSRHGLTPRSRTALPVEPYGDFESDPAHTASQLLRRVRAAISGAAAEGKPWESVVEAIRQQSIALWQ